LSFGSKMALAFDLTLDDYNDEDLSEILQDNELHIHSYANGSFKVCDKSTIWLKKTLSSTLNFVVLTPS